MKRLSIPLLLALLASSCLYRPLRSDAGVRPVGVDGPGGWSSQTPTQGSTLYARDGSPVQGPVGGEVIANKGNLKHDVEKDSSRLYLLELYQTAMDEKDELKVELDSLDQMLQRSDQYNRELEERIQTMQAELIASRAKVEELSAKNLELAGRLTTAEIRRLETKKALLETRLEWERAAAELKGTPLNQQAGGQR